MESDPQTVELGVSDVVAVLNDENRALEDALAVSRRRLAAMRDVAKALAGRLDLDELLKVILAKVREVADCDRATLFLVDENRGELWSRVIEGSAPIRLPIGSGVAGSVAKTGIGVKIEDAYRDPRFNPAVDKDTGYRTRSILCLPIFGADGRPMGVVEALNKRTGPFSVEDERVLEAICDQISVALQNAMVFGFEREQARSLDEARAALSRRVSELDVLVETERGLAGADDADGVIDAILSRAQGLCGADAASLALLDKTTSRLRFHAAVGVGRERTVGVVLPPETGLIGAAFSAQQVIRVDDAAADPRHALSLAREMLLSPGPLCAVPLIAEGGAIGVLTVLRANGSAPFTADDERILTLLGGRVASAFHTAERREKTRQAEQLETIGTMLAGIVHDFKTPMTVISGYVQLMQTEDDVEERGRSAETVLKHCDMMTSMIKELLQFARGESELLVRKVYLQAFLREVEDIARRIIGDSGITLEVHTSYRGAARFDDVKLKRALSNLIKNAREALTTGGAIRVTAEQIGDQVEFVVADNGPGLPPEIEARLFESFATHGKRDGTGLGLPLVKKIVVDHGGEVRVESRRGEGVAFRLRLPL